MYALLYNIISHLSSNPTEMPNPAVERDCANKPSRHPLYYFRTINLMELIPSKLCCNSWYEALSLILI